MSGRRWAVLTSVVVASVVLATDEVRADSPAREPQAAVASSSQGKDAPMSAAQQRNADRAAAALRAAQRRQAAKASRPKSKTAPAVGSTPSPKKEGTP